MTTPDPYSTENWLGRSLRRLTGTLQRYALLFVAVSLALTAVCGWYARHNLGINTDTTDMISAKLDWRRDFIEFREAFPILWRSIVVVIDGDSADLAEQARVELREALHARDDLFVFVEGTESDEFFERQGLLYQQVGELTALSDRLAEIQPFLGRLSRDPTLRGFADMLALAATAQDRGAALELDRLMRELELALEAGTANRFHRFPWLELMTPEDGDVGADRRRLILLEPRLDDQRVAPAREPIEFVYRLARELELDTDHGVRVRLTGPVALEYEELRSVSRGAGVAGAVSLVMVLIVLFAGLRSPGLVLASLLTLVCGLIVTAAFAAFAVGRLNLISVAFAVLYIGLGIDFSAHYCLRFRELLLQGVDRREALNTTASDVGASLILCAVTTSIGFFAFFPTSFTGVSELGIISGVGMYISLLANLVMLPALLRLLPPWLEPAPRRAAATTRGAAAIDAPASASAATDSESPLPLPQRRPRLVISLAVLAALAALIAIPFVSFDPNPLNLRDPDSASVTAYRDLLADSATSPLTLNLLVDDLMQASEDARRARALPLVDAARSLESFVPTEQQEKLELLEELSFIMGPDLRVDAAEALSEAQRIAALEQLQDAVTALASDPAAIGSGAERTLSALNEFRDTLEALPPAAASERLIRFETSVLAGFTPQMERLQRALEARPVDYDSLPADLRARWTTPDGRQRVELVPAEDLSDNDAMRRFVEQTRELHATATGLPVVQLGAGKAVASAFLQAIVTALVAVALLLMLLLRSVRDTLEVLGPVVLASVLTAAATVLLGLDFNFANVIALPLLLGMGVDNGIHLVHRYRSAPPAGGNLLATSTARAIVLSAVTTIVSFGNLGLSEHPGTASMGVLLAAGLALILVCTLLVLPALLTLHPPEVVTE
jgi:hopanoid biosynthesis associated RND transporter like protein HpnN